jgi:hypothetical protein
MDGNPAILPCLPATPLAEADSSTAVRIDAETWEDVSIGMGLRYPKLGSLVLILYRRIHDYREESDLDMNDLGRCRYKEEIDTYTYLAYLH